jgi:hypothetical protein
MKRTLHQNSQLHALVTKLKISAEQKEELVYQFTRGKHISSAQMSVDECQTLINSLKHISRTLFPAIAKPRGMKDAENKMRRKILSICHEMNWKKNNNLDWERINGFILKSGHLNKENKTLNDYTATELPLLITQFEQLLKEYYAKR